MSAAEMNAMFQWIISFLKKLIEKFNELMSILNGEEDSSEA